MKKFNFNEHIRELKAASKDKAVRKVNVKKLRKFILIVCEGTKSEPNYFESFRVRMPRGSLEKVSIVGTGINTTSLVEYTKGLVAKRQESRLQDFDSVWVVFDRDSFVKNNVNQAVKMASQLGYNVALSNEAFELWYILHFEYLDSKNNRKQYMSKLNQIFKSIGIGKYKKKSEDIYKILQEYGDEKLASKFARKLESIHKGKTAEKSKPSTSVYKLVKLLNDYLP